MDEQITAKPCPFCGGTIERESALYFNEEADSCKWGCVACACCSSQGPHVRTSYQTFEHWRDDAIAEWNQRKEAV